MISNTTRTVPNRFDTDLTTTCEDTDTDPEDAVHPHSWDSRSHLESLIFSCFSLAFFPHHSLWTPLSRSFSSSSSQLHSHSLQRDPRQEPCETRLQLLLLWYAYPFESKCESIDEAVQSGTQHWDREGIRSTNPYRSWVRLPWDIPRLLSEVEVQRIEVCRTCVWCLSLSSRDVIQKNDDWYIILVI